MCISMHVPKAKNLTALTSSNLSHSSVYFHQLTVLPAPLTFVPGAPRLSKHTYVRLVTLCGPCRLEMHGHGLTWRILEIGLSDEHTQDDIAGNMSGFADTGIRISPKLTRNCSPPVQMGKQRSTGVSQNAEILSGRVFRTVSQ